MFKTFIIHADSPKHEKPAEGIYTNLSNFLPSLLILIRPEAKEPA
jgi:hypothetical protein